MTNIRIPWIQSRGFLLLLVLWLSPLLAACGAGAHSDPARTPETDGTLCRAGLDAQETLHIVATTGQIGNTVRLIAGLDTIDPALWSPAAIAARTSWSGGMGEEGEAPGAIQPVDLDIQVSVMLGPGLDPHLYLPTLKDAELLNAADLILYNGLHLEAQMLHALAELAQTRCVMAIGDVLYTAEEFTSQFLHDQDGLVDPHIWNSPTLWRAATDVVAHVLDDMYTGEQPAFHHNAAVVTAFLERAEDIILDMFSDDEIPVKYLVTAHDAFGYYSALTGLETIGLQGLSTETEVSAYDIQAIADTIVAQQIPAIFVETSVSEDAIEAVRAAVQARGWQLVLGGELYSDALGPAGSEGESYLGMLQHNTVTIYQALTGTGAVDPE